MAEHTVAAIVLGSHEVARMIDMLLAILAHDLKPLGIMMHVEDANPQRQDHDEQQDNCAEGLSMSELHT